MSQQIARELVNSLRKFTHKVDNKEYDITCSAPAIKQKLNGKVYYSVSIEMNPNDPLNAEFKNLQAFTAWFQATFAKSGIKDLKYSSAEFLQIVLPNSVLSKFQVEIAPADQAE